MDNDNGLEDGPFGVVGVAPACSLYALKVLDDAGWGVSSNLIGALEWAVEHGIQVANLSLGWDQNPGSIVEEAFNKAYDAGIVIVAAACNNGNRAGKGETVCWPGKFGSVIAVAATDGDDRRATFSSTGVEVELAAPGVSVFSTWNDSTGYYAPDPVCHLENGVEACYKEGSGTSMASPHVAGVAALIIKAGIEDTNGDGRVNDEVRSVLIATAHDLGASGWDPLYGYGLVNAVAAVAAVSPPVPVTDIAVEGIEAPDFVTRGGVANVLVTVTNTGNQDVSASFAVTLTDTSDGAVIGTGSVEGGLASGASAALTYAWDTATASVGQHVLVASHDLVDDNAVNNAASALVTVTDLPQETLTITGIDPHQVYGGTTTGVTITGSGFQQGAVVTFEGGRGVAPVASNVAVSSDGTSMTVDVTTNRTPKVVTWDVRVTNPGGASVVLAGGLVVSP